MNIGTEPGRERIVEPRQAPSAPQLDVEARGRRDEPEVDDDWVPDSRIGSLPPQSRRQTPIIRLMVFPVAATTSIHGIAPHHQA